MGIISSTPRAEETPAHANPHERGSDETSSSSGSSSRSNGSIGRRILFLDAYDSFTNNIVSLLKDALGANVAVHVLHMDLKTVDSDATPDWTRQQFLQRLSDFDAVVCGPGPGSPLHDADVGVFKLLWDLPQEQAVPVLGICLGFQSLVEHFGGSIRRLRRGLHGMVREIDHVQAPPADIFDQVPRFKATLYHSLCADIGQDRVPEQDWPEARWVPFKQAPELQPLAWILEDYDGDSKHDPERILMAARHATRPLWGVQYHPESVCTEAAAGGVVRNWFRRALEWNEAAGRKVPGKPSVDHADSLNPLSRSLPGLDSGRTLSACPWWNDLQSGLAQRGVKPGYTCRRIKLPAGVDTADIAEVLGLGDKDTIILDSSSTVNGDPLARSSIVALAVDEALRMEYHVGDSYMVLRQPASRGRQEASQRIHLGEDVDPWSPWHVMSEYWRWRRVTGDDDAPAFKGGFVGFVTYEMGLSTLSPGSVPGARGHSRPDLCMAWVTKSVVLDHQAGVAYVQALTCKDGDDLWIDHVVQAIEASHPWRHPGCGRSPHAKSGRSNEALLDDVRKGRGRLRVSVPDSNGYESDVSKCQDYIKDGESYELCLTAQTTMTRPRGNDQPHHTRTLSAPGEQPPQNLPPVDEACRHGTPWQIYRTLRARQPAPFGSFARLGGVTVISSSPERFLTHDPKGLCCMRPMKGTVRKSPAVSTLAQAEEILHVPKEEAENLMIVDLVRHDLHGVCGAQSVTVPDQLRVEEYASVFQMVTAVNGQLPAEKLEAGTDPARGEFPFTGMDVLASCLPPGSMTGAPKKRSCDILRTIEPAERSVYSGVIGYLDVQGKGDWSVTIRTMFRWDDEQAPAEAGEAEPREVWRIGAGGAVTTLSTPEGERDEMFTKLCGPLGTFSDVA
ncbi:hypercellular protein HypA [Metarhizium album ARSEF 1941]|uniref:aminodeoxychorismate synthase n=1 Tax=Metarhizium album (strain ARSEF 1941) TaxID=1081103 RepID=A0A0B2WNW1_METAS|nr:hypercellular protein HypA [Metarhizium album ARSEF 1941]KHN95688.1 hypercellular protein HypA [Metarhizium album ARSEF 1941]